MGPIIPTQHLRGVALLAVWVMALAWPWELFQRIPGLGVTFVKPAAVIILLTAGWALWRIRDWRRLHCGLERPIALMALACGVSLAVSVDRAATLAMLQQYLLYLMLFYALAFWLQSATVTWRVGQAFVVSASLAALLAIACAAGFAFPTLATPNEFQGYFISPELRSGALMRMAATTDDFNQGVLCFVLAFPMALMLFMGAERGYRGNLAGFGFAALLLAGIVVSFSRSSMLALGLMPVLALVIGLRTQISKQKLLLFIGIAFLLMLPALLLYYDALVERFMRGIFTRDASYDSRMYVFELGWQLLPQYMWLGAGLGASDHAIQAVADPVRLQGITIHSVPFKLFLETGILGLFAYFWLWARLFQLTWRHGLLAREHTKRKLGLALLCAYIGCFFVMLVQPFMALSIFPLLAAMSRGPLRQETTQPQDRAIAEGANFSFRERPLYMAATVAVALIVAFNVVRYQQTGQRLDAYTNMLYEAVRAELQGNWPQALARYSQAQDLAIYYPALPQEAGQSVADIHQLPYYDIARAIPDFHYLHRVMALGEYLRDPVAVGTLGLARTQMAIGDPAAAGESLRSAIAITPDWAAAWYYRGRAAWRSGDFLEAVTAYQSARALTADWRNHAYAAWITALEKQVDSIQAHSSEPESWVRAGILEVLITVGRWEEAVAIAEATASLAESQYVLGISKELEAKETAAQTHYQRALVIEPTHLSAQQRLLR